jgi:RNA polymerase sigma-70 factor (ECF subfamily)
MATRVMLQHNADDRHAQAGGVADQSLDARRAARFEVDVIPLRNRLYHRALGLTRNTQDAEDLVQDTILNAYAGFRTFREGTDLMAWLCRIMHNSWIDRCRRNRRWRVEVSVGSISDDQLAIYAGRTARVVGSAEVVALESLPDSSIKAALMTLTEASRLSIYYADVEGFSYREIADMMNVPVGTVVSRLHRGRRQLRKNLLIAASRRGLASERTRDDPCLVAQ